MKCRLLSPSGCCGLPSISVSLPNGSISLVGLTVVTSLMGVSSSELVDVENEIELGPSTDA